MLYFSKYLPLNFFSRVESPAPAVAEIRQPEVEAVTAKAVTAIEEKRAVLLEKQEEITRILLDINSEKDTKNTIGSSLIKGSSVFVTAADMARYTVNGFHIVSGHLPILNELRGFCFLSLPGIFKEMWGAGKEILGKGDDKVSAAVTFVSNMGGLCDVTATTITFLDGFGSVAKEVVAVVNPLFLAMAVTDLAVLSKQGYDFYKAHQFSKGLNDSSTDKLKSIVHNQKKSFIEECFGFKRDLLEKIIDTVDDDDKKKVKTALCDRVKNDQWAKGLTILIGVVKLVFLMVLLFSPLNVGLGAVLIGCVLLITAKLLLNHWVSTDKQKFKANMELMLIESVKNTSIQLQTKAS